MALTTVWRSSPQSSTLDIMNRAWLVGIVALLTLSLSSSLVVSFPIPVTDNSRHREIRCLSASRNLLLEPFKVIEDVPEYCGVKPSVRYYRTTPLIKDFARWTWRRRHFVLKMLHWRDELTPVDSCINLECLWWKALSTTNPRSPCYEPYTYDLLPRPGRTILSSLRRFHPRWIHALLEIRMAYLNQAVAQEMAHTKRPVQIVSLGAGYDTRSIRMLNNMDHASGNVVVGCYEFDLPSSIESKERLIQERLAKRRSKRGLSELTIPTMIGLDLNDTEEFQRQLSLICRTDTDLHTIFVVEGVIMYLDKGKAEAALQACAKATAHSSLCFADRLFENFQVDPVPIQDGLRALGWDLIEWAPSPNANAKHMGIARPVRADTTR